MTEPHHSELPALTAPPQAHPRAWTDLRRQPVLWLVIATLILALLLAWRVWQDGGRMEEIRHELARRLADNDATQRETQANARQNREVLDALQAKVGVLEARLTEMQGQQAALDSMYQELSRVRDDRLIAEIEQTVSIAAQQLQLAGNVEAALIALQGAEGRLARSNQPQFLTLRKLIARDIERLKALPGADVAGIALKLDSIQNAISGLPLAFDHRPAPVNSTTPPRPEKKSMPGKAEQPAPSEPEGIPAGPVWQAMLRGWLHDVWQEVRQLVRIERIDRPDPGLLSPRETFFLRENLRLRLLSARLALLARDGRSFQADLQQARKWLNQYFDSDAPAVRDALATLNALAKLDVMREPSELNETLSALRNFKQARDRTVR